MYRFDIILNDMTINVIYISAGKQVRHSITFSTPLNTALILFLITPRSYAFSYLLSTPSYAFGKVTPVCP